MGWYFTLGASRRDIAEEVTRTFTNESSGVTQTMLARYFSGNDLWVVFEQLKADGSPAVGTDGRFIVLFKLSRGSGDGWGYKPIEESMGPCDRSCPPKFLKMVPEPPNEYGREWREGVAQYWARRRERRALRKRRRA